MEINPWGAVALQGMLQEQGIMEIKELTANSVDIISTRILEQHLLL